MLLALEVTLGQVSTVGKARKPDTLFFEAYFRAKKHTGYSIPY